MEGQDTDTTVAGGAADTSPTATPKRVNGAVRPIVTIGLVDNDQFALAFLARSLTELMPEARIL